MDDRDDRRMTRAPRPELPAVFLGRDAVAAGALTTKQLRGPTVRRMFRGVYRPSEVTADHELMTRAAALVLPAGAVISGASALGVHGVELRRAADPVHVVVPPHTGPVHARGLEVHRRIVGPAEVVPWSGVQLATPLRATVDLLLGREAELAVADLDRVLRAGLVDPRGLAVDLARRHDRGVVLARESAWLGDSRAESPPESWLRVVLVRAGLEPEPQVRVFDARGRFVARVDLGYRRERVAVEYDGAWHGEPSQLQRDRDRLNRLAAAGWRVVFVTAADRRRPVREITERVAAALASA
jgi:very-short-patch-repair endonuclease